MRKIITIIIIVFNCTMAIGQTLNGFKYIYIPTLKYENGYTDTWNISQIIRSQFIKMGMIVLTESNSLIDEIANNPSIVLIAKVNHYSDPPGFWGGFYSHIELQLIDCNNHLVLSLSGKGKGLNVQDDYNIAAKEINKQLSKIDYTYDESKNPTIELPVVEHVNDTEESIKAYLTSNNLDPIEGIYKSYQNAGLPYYKIGIIRKGERFKAIMLESDLKYWKQGEVKAVFEQSSIKGIYSTKWYMGNKTSYETFANMDNEATLSIELKDQSTGEKHQDHFLKMFPMVSSNTMVKKYISKASGSGFFMTSTGIIATNAHVVEGASDIEVIISNEINNNTYKARILLVDKNNDVAILQISDDRFKGLTSIPFSIVENLDVGSKVFTIGYPLNDIMGNNYKVTDGIISAKSGVGDDIRYYQISVPLQPGNSGGPLFSKEGNVIGITTARLNPQVIGTQVENVNYAIKSTYLLNLYKMLPNQPKLNSVSTIASKELKDQIKVLKNYVCQIKIY